MADPNHSQLIPGVWGGWQIDLVSQVFKIRMKAAECKLHKVCPPFEIMM